MGYTDPITVAVGDTAHAADWNSYVRDNFRSMGMHLIVRKTADESVTSSTTLQNDDVLALSVAANEVWRFNLDLLFQSAGASDFKYGFTFPAAAVLYAATTFGPDTNGVLAMNVDSTATSPSAPSQWQAQGATQPTFLQVQGVFVNGANAGTLQLQWAQVVSGGTATTVKANSCLWGVKLA